MKYDSIPSEKIDKGKWDAVIDKHESGLIYATKDYLDAMCENWTGIVFDDYTDVFPIPWKEKYGIKYCYTVPFIQQLGMPESKQLNIFSDTLYDAVLKEVKYGDYNFNFFNNLLFVKGVIKNNNYILLLSDYETVVKEYSQDLISNLKKASSQNFIYTDATIDEALDIYIQLYSERTPHVTKKDYENFRAICKKFENSGKAFSKKIISKTAETLAIGLFLKDRKRIYNMANSTTNVGRKASANYFLFDELIRENCSKNLMLDFEGSDIEGIEYFYKKFGAINQPYQSLHINELPWPLNLLKK